MNKPTTEMTILDELMQRSTFTLLVIGTILLLVGLPKKKVRYRILAAVLAILSIGAALQWYATYIVGLHYFRESAHWPYLLASGFFVVAFGFLLWELSALRLFRRLTKPE